MLQHMNRNLLIAEIDSYGSFSFSRSSGPGGQNVNKVNTKVQLTLHLENLPSFSVPDSVSEAERERISFNLGQRLKQLKDGAFFIEAQRERTQLANRRLAVKRMADCIIDASRPAEVRKATAPTKASKQRRLDCKKAQGRKKLLRSNPAKSSVDSEL
jgi:ribosome-associated protein